MALPILGGTAAPSDVPKQRPAHALDEFERHLARCRRSGTAAALLLARATGAADLPPDVEQRMRTADSVLRTGARELLVLCDAPASPAGCAPLDRDALQRRLRALAGGGLACAWASYPDDGLVLDDLLRCVRLRAATPARRATRLSLLTGRA
jgi:hypothetical protein